MNTIEIFYCEFLTYWFKSQYRNPSVKMSVIDFYAAINWRESFVPFSHTMFLIPSELHKPPAAGKNNRMRYEFK